VKYLIGTAHSYHLTLRNCMGLKSCHLPEVDYLFIENNYMQDHEGVQLIRRYHQQTSSITDRVHSEDY